MPITSCTYGALALECSASLAHTALTRDAAAELAGYVAADLARLLPGVEALDLAVAGAGFDPSELLRPGWPLHAALADLAQRAPGRNGPRVLGFGSHEGAMPAQISPDPALREGPLRLVPFVLHGKAEDVAAIGRAMEEVLLETGMAWAEEPPSRTRHMISNLQISETDVSDVFAVRLNYLLYRAQKERDETFYVGTRVDKVRRLPGDEWRLLAREIVLDQAVITSHNLSVLF